MTTEAVGKGFYHSEGWHRDYPRLQILTVEELLSGKQVDMPPIFILLHLSISRRISLMEFRPDALPDGEVFAGLMVDRRI